MATQLRQRVAVLLAGFGFVAIAHAEPTKPMAINTPVSAKPMLPKVEPKLEVKPLSKVEPKPVPKIELKPEVKLPAKIETKPDVKLPAKIDAVKPAVIVEPIKKPEIKLPAKVVVPESKVTAKPESRPVVVHPVAQAGKVAELPKGPALKLPTGVAFKADELAKIKPPVDLTKTKPEVVLGVKPPKDFKATPIGLDKIHIPTNAKTVEKLSFKSISGTQSFVLNANHYKAGDYHTRFGTRGSFGYYYPGRQHCHWHHCIWDPCFKCNYFYCPSACCYYYWCEADVCYYPCHWFVNYGTCYYPWWICGGFGGYGYVGTPSVSVFVGF